MAVKKIINDRQRARKVYGFIQRLPDRVALASTAAESEASVLKLDWKESVKFASTGNITPFPPAPIDLLNAIDGTALADGDRILIKDQSTTSENGIYEVDIAGLTWTRAPDAVPNDTLTCGATVYVEEGTSNGATRWVLSAITVGGDQTWSQDISVVPGSDTQIIFNDGGALGTSANFTFNTTTNVLAVTGSVGVQGQIVPSTDLSYSLGAANRRWANIYTGDLHLRNDKGDWTLIEEEEFLMLRNNKTEKLYKFVVEPVETGSESSSTESPEDHDMSDSNR